MPAKQPEPEEDIQKSVRFPQAVWDALELDAKRSRRSLSAQIQVILEEYYDLNSAELDQVAMERTRARFGQTKQPKRA